MIKIGNITLSNNVFWPLWQEFAIVHLEELLRKRGVL